LANYELLLTIKKINIYVIAVAGGDPDVSRVGVDVERAAHEPLVAHHVAAVGVDLDVALLEDDKEFKIRLIFKSVTMEGYEIDIFNASFYFEIYSRTSR
jgi:hypothetical protein